MGNVELARRKFYTRGNVEYDRYTGQVYDYLNVFPFYIGYARKRAVDMPGVEVLDPAGIPLLSDSFPRDQTFKPSNSSKERSAGPRSRMRSCAVSPGKLSYR